MGWVVKATPPAALPPGKTRYPLYRRLGGPQGRSGRVWKISPTPGFDPRTVQSIVPAPATLLTRRIRCEHSAVRKHLCVCLHVSLWFVVIESQNAFHPLREVTCCRMEVLRSTPLHVFFTVADVSFFSAQF